MRSTYVWRRINRAKLPFVLDDDGDWVVTFNCEAAAEALCRLDNATGSDTAVEGIPCDVHREAARQAINAALDIKEGQ